MEGSGEGMVAIIKGSKLNGLTVTVVPILDETRRWDENGNFYNTIKFKFQCVNPGPFMTNLSTVFIIREHQHQHETSRQRRDKSNSCQ